MRKFLFAAVAAAIAVAGFSVIANAGQGEPGSSLDITLKPKKVDKPAALDAVVEPTKVDDQGTADTSDDVYTPAKKNTLIFARRSSVDRGALRRCELTPTEAGQGENCPNKTKLGEGASVSYIGGDDVGSGKRQGGTPLNGEVDAYNLKRTQCSQEDDRQCDLLLVVQPCAPGTGPGTDNDCVPAGQRVVLPGKWSKVATRPKLVVVTPPGLIALGVVITRLELDIDKHTKTVKVKGEEVLRSFILTPETCKGKWKSLDRIEYSDGSEQTIRDSQKCRKPAA